MITKHLIAGFVFGVSMSVISWIVGMIVNSILMKTEYYKKLSSLNFITSKTWNKRLGIRYFKWIVKNTFFKFFNPAIKVPNRKTDLTEIRYQMTLSEISHLIGFAFVVLVAIYQSFRVSIVFGLMMMIGNILLNLYPSLLQQENKRRIDKLLERHTAIVS
ncbi:MAG: hypothetical protein HRU41_30465 [Saprospiraceae bacterium]|nr:hypothetical protein [Saprospiraceae bacterium]